MSQKGRKKGGGRFAKLPVVLLEHEAVTTLSHAAFRVMVLLAAEFRGFNNGDLGVTYDQAKKAGIGSKHTFYDALKELEERGLIQKTEVASRTPPRPTKFLLTWLQIDDTEYSRKRITPLNLYKKWSANTQ